MGKNIIDSMSRVSEGFLQIFSYVLSFILVIPFALCMFVAKLIYYPGIFIGRAIIEVESEV